MTKYHEQQAKIRLNIDGNICQICKKPLNSLGCGAAHRLSKSRSNLKAFGEKIINHNFNLVYTCLDCNSKVLIDNKYNKKNILYYLIKTRGHERLTYDVINQLLGVNYE
jgi:hypothetical protein